MENIIFLPGLSKQIENFTKKFQFENKKILIVGPNSAKIAKAFSESNEIEIIMEDYESFIETMDEARNLKNVKVKMMEYTNTDYEKKYFDIIYSQAAISKHDRNKILKEIKRISKNDAIYSIGEIVTLQKPIPKFVEDIYFINDLEPLFKDEIEEYYKKNGFTIEEKDDLSFTLKKFYELCLNLTENLDDKEYKELKTRLYHESNSFLKFGGDKYMGYYSFLLRRSDAN